MRQRFINLAKSVYRNTPSRPLRELYFRTFCAITRNRIVQSSIDGITYELDLGETIDMGIYLGAYELDMVSAVERLCRPGYIVLDIGANIGAHALRFARIAGESGKVYAFEPTNYGYRKLAHNVSLNSFNNIRPMQIALSDRNQPQQTINFISSWPTKGSPKESESVVDVIKLDDWCRKEEPERVDLIKLDVDGNEYAVIMGAISLLTSQRPIILMEVWGPNFAHDSRNPFSSLQELGYRFFHIETGDEYETIEALRAPVSSDGKLLDYSYNIVAKC